MAGIVYLKKIFVALNRRVCELVVCFMGCVNTLSFEVYYGEVEDVIFGVRK